MAVAALAAIPTIWLVAVYGVDIPLTDEWAMVPLLRKSVEGGLGLADFWHFHNEHRPLFPRILLLGLARATSWDVTWELKVNLILAAASTVLVVARFMTLARPATFTLLPLAVATLIFSPVQWHNWLWGWQVEVFLCVLSFLLGTAMLTSSSPSGWRLLGAIGCGLVSSLSYGSGLGYWISALPLVVFGTGGRSRLSRAIVWILAAAALVSLYFTGFGRPGHHPPFALVYSEPGTVLRFVAVYIGAALSPDRLSWATFLGALALLAWIALALRASWPAPSRLGLFSICVGGFALLSAVITAQARAGFGPRQALTSRYTTFSVLLWVSLLLLVETLEIRKLWWPRAKATLHVVVIALSVWAADAAWPRALDRSDALATARLALLEASYSPDRLATDPRFRILLPRPEGLAKSIEFMRANRLSVFR